MSHPAAQQNVAPVLVLEDGTALAHVQGAPAQGHDIQNGAGAAQNDQLNHGDAGHQADQHPLVWPAPGTPEREAYEQAQRGTRQNQFVRFRHWIGQRVVGFAAYLEGGNNEQVAERMQAYWNSREAERTEADNRPGLITRAFSRLAGRAIGATDGAGRRWDYLIHGPGEGRANGPWNFSATNQAGTPAQRQRTNPGDQHRAPVAESQRQRLIGRIPRDPLIPFSRAADREAVRDERRARRGASGGGTDNSQRRGRRGGQENRSGRIDTSDPAVAFAMHEYNQLPLAEQEATNPGAWIVERAKILPDTEWGKIAVARMAQYLSGTPEHEHETEAWDRLMAEPYLLPTGMNPEDWVQARARLNLASALRASDEAVASDERIDSVRADVQRERAARAAKELAEREREAKVAERAQAIANIIQAQLKLPRVEMSHIEGNRRVRAQERAEWALRVATAQRSRLKLPIRFNDPNRTEDENYSESLHTRDAVIYALLDTKLTTKQANLNEEEARLNSEALIRAVLQTIGD